MTNNTKICLITNIFSDLRKICKKLHQIFPHEKKRSKFTSRKQQKVEHHNQSKEIRSWQAFEWRKHAAMTLFMNVCKIFYRIIVKSQKKVYVSSCPLKRLSSYTIHNTYDLWSERRRKVKIRTTFFLNSSQIFTFTDQLLNRKRLFWSQKSTLCKWQTDILTPNWEYYF